MLYRVIAWPQRYKHHLKFFLHKGSGGKKICTIGRNFVSNGTDLDRTQRCRFLNIEYHLAMNTLYSYVKYKKIEKKAFSTMNSIYTVLERVLHYTVL